ncbi:hypothetical protein ACLMAJ_28345 [Nocardia sp. KC 131]|uniref:hypothetical protein n=1 Tax=Nocardia arseniciresistens TaxID=3392119 RepID=UPI00398F4EB8
MVLHSKGRKHDDAAAADHVAEDLLRMFGVLVDEAHEICQLPLPSLNYLQHDGSAASTGTMADLARPA